MTRPSPISIYSKVLLDILAKEVKQGWRVPIPKNFIRNIPNAEVTQVGLAQQWQAHKDGSRFQKFHLTHNQSFEASWGQSVNARVQKDKPDDLYYGHSLNRLIHYIMSIGLQYTSAKILLAKADLKGAYRRITLNGVTAARCIITRLFGVFGKAL